MAGVDPSLGISADFPEADFRNAIAFAMQMGASPDPTLQPTFVFPAGIDQRVYTRSGTPVDASDVRLDPMGKPLDPEVKWVDGLPTKKRVDCAIEITRADANELPVGNFRPTKATVTVLDAAHDQIKGCREMIYNGDRYQFGYEPDAMGLFQVGVFTMIFYAIDEN